MWKGRKYSSLHPPGPPFLSFCLTRFIYEKKNCLPCSIHMLHPVHGCIFYTTHTHTHLHTHTHTHNVQIYRHGAPPWIKYSKGIKFYTGWTQFCILQIFGSFYKPARILGIGRKKRHTSFTQSFYRSRTITNYISIMKYSSELSLSWLVF